MAKPFAEIVLELAAPAAAHEFTLARQASHFAKVARDHVSKSTLHTIKTRAVGHAVQLAPRRVWIGDLARINHGIVGVGFGKLGQLHVPLRDLPQEAKRIVEWKLAALRVRTRGEPSGARRPATFHTMGVCRERGRSMNRQPGLGFSVGDGSFWESHNFTPTPRKHL